MASCRTCGSSLVHFSNPDRMMCPSGCSQSADPARAKDGTRRGGKLKPEVTRNPAKARKNPGKRGDQGKHK